MMTKTSGLSHFNMSNICTIVTCLLFKYSTGKVTSILAFASPSNQVINVWHPESLAGILMLCICMVQWVWLHYSTSSIKVYILVTLLTSKLAMQQHVKRTSHLKTGEQVILDFVNAKIWWSMFVCTFRGVDDEYDGTVRIHNRGIMP